MSDLQTAAPDTATPGQGLDMPGHFDGETDQPQPPDAGTTKNWSKDLLGRLWKSRRKDTIDHAAISSLSQEKTNKGKPVTLLVTADRDAAIADCKKKVDRIIRDCRIRNRRFRDEQFDISTQRQMCLQALANESPEWYAPFGVARVTEIFENPTLFGKGVKADDLKQGAIGDCWFASALATVASMPHLIEQLCVHRDEELGIYGFMFFRDGGWITTVIDDQLFLGNSKYDELSKEDHATWNHNRELYEKAKLTGSRALYFAACADQNETWVPLYEKAFAKAHGDYESISGGFTGQGIEDLTGGISTLLVIADILNKNKFWTEELMRVGKDRLFACYTNVQAPGQLDITRIIPGHAYAILEAKEVNGKRFLLIQNPWGEKGEWTGPWSDGAKEWTPEWMKDIGHRFGNDGRFIMEYGDFLKTWETVDRCRLFDDSWTVASHPVKVKTRVWPAAAAFGDVSFTVTLTKSTPTVFVLAQQDTRYFTGLEGDFLWSMEFRIFELDGDDYIARSEKGFFSQRSVNVELELEAGTYIVHVRLDRICTRTNDTPPPADSPLQELRDTSPNKMSKVVRQQMDGIGKASNFDPSDAPANLLSPPSSLFKGQPLSKLPNWYKKTPVIQGTDRKDDTKTSTPEAKCEKPGDKAGSPDKQDDVTDKSDDKTSKKEEKQDDTAAKEDGAASKEEVKPDKVEDDLGTAKSDNQKDAQFEEKDSKEGSEKKDDKPTDDAAQSKGKIDEKPNDEETKVTVQDGKMDGAKVGVLMMKEPGKDGDADPNKVVPVPDPVIPSGDKPDPTPDAEPKKNEIPQAKKEVADDESTNDQETDAVYLSLRVYSHDANSKVEAETRL